MRLIFLNRFYWPDEPATAQLLTDLAIRLAAHGHEVVVVTSRPRTTAAPRREIQSGVTISRIQSPRLTGRFPGAKAIDFGWFWVAALFRLFVEVRRDDTIIAMTDPPLAGMGAWLIGRLRRARVIHWVQDIYPELAILLAGQSWLKAIRPWRDVTWRRAAHCVTLGSEMAAVIAGAGVPSRRVTVIPNWAPAALDVPPDSEVKQQREAWNVADRFVIAYSGNLGRVHDLEPILELAGLLRETPAIVFLFIGDGAQRTRLETEANRNRLSNVLFRPSQPRARLATALRVGDAHLVTLRPDCEHYVYPSKLYGIAAIGRPIVFIGPRDCELARSVRDHAMGVTAVRNEMSALAAELRAWVGDHALRARCGASALRFAAATGGADAAAARWDKLLSTLGPC